MKTKILSGGLLMVILTLLFSCNQENKVTSIDKDKVKAEIQAIEDQFALTYNTRNADSITYYAEEAVSYFAGQEPISGKDAIHRHIQDELMDFPIGAKISFETLEIYVAEDGDHVAEIGTHKLVDSTGVVLQRGHYMSFFVKKDGKYVCARDMATTVLVEN